MKTLEAPNGIVHDVYVDNRTHGWTRCRQPFQYMTSARVPDRVVMARSQRFPNCLLCFTWPITP